MRSASYSYGYAASGQPAAPARELKTPLRRYGWFIAPNSAGSATYDNGSKVIATAGAVQTTAALVGTTTSTLGSNGKVYTGSVSNGKFYPGWGGNGSVATVKIAEVATKFGWFLAAGATAWDWINVLNGSGSISPTKATVNTGFTAVGLAGGIPGGVTATGYFLIDNYYPGGWTGNGGTAYNGAGALRDYATTVEENRKVVPNWNPRGTPPFF